MPSEACRADWELLKGSKASRAGREFLDKPSVSPNGHAGRKTFGLGHLSERTESPMAWHSEALHYGLSEFFRQGVAIEEWVRGVQHHIVA